MCILLGVLALLITFKLVRRLFWGCGYRRYGRYGRHAWGRHGCGPHGCGPHGHGPGFGRHCGHDDYEDRARGFDDDGRADDGPGFRGPFGFGRGRIAEMVFDRLELTPTQRRTVREAVAELEKDLREQRGELKKTKDDVATALRSDDFDVEVLGSLFARQDDVISEVRKAMTGALGKVHGVLDEEQRARLARMLERGWR